MKNLNQNLVENHEFTDNTDHTKKKKKQKYMTTLMDITKQPY